MSLTLQFSPVLGTLFHLKGCLTQPWCDGLCLVLLYLVVWCSVCVPGGIISKRWGTGRSREKGSCRKDVLYERILNKNQQKEEGKKKTWLKDTKRSFCVPLAFKRKKNTIKSSIRSVFSSFFHDNQRFVPLELKTFNCLFTKTIWLTDNAQWVKWLWDQLRRAVAKRAWVIQDIHDLRILARIPLKGKCPPVNVCKQNLRKKILAPPKKCQLKVSFRQNQANKTHLFNVWGSVCI